MLELTDDDGTTRTYQSNGYEVTVTQGARKIIAVSPLPKNIRDYTPTLSWNGRRFDLMMPVFKSDQIPEAIEELKKVHQLAEEIRAAEENNII